MFQRSVPVLLHDVLKRPEEVFLEAEIGKFSFLQELHGELSQRVNSENGYVLIGVTAHLHKRQQPLMKLRYKFTNVTKNDYDDNAS